MDRTYWQKQTADKPLFPDLQWSRPEHKSSAGKLLIVGGNAHGFTAPAEAYTEASSAGIGTARVVLPDSLHKTLGKVFEAGEFAPSNPSGGFSQKALAELLDASLWSDGVLFAGDLGRNSETAILLEYFLDKFSGQVTLTKDAADYFLEAPGPLLARENTSLVLSFSQLQKFAAGGRFAQPFTSNMGTLRLVDTLHEFTKRFECKIITRCGEAYFVADNARISTTNLPDTPKVWRLKAATHAATWWLQNPAKSYEALTTAMLSVL